MKPYLSSCIHGLDIDITRKSLGHLIDIWSLIIWLSDDEVMDDDYLPLVMIDVECNDDALFIFVFDSWISEWTIIIGMWWWRFFGSFDLIYIWVSCLSFGVLGLISFFPSMKALKYSVMQLFQHWIWSYIILLRIGCWRHCWWSYLIFVLYLFLESLLFVWVVYLELGYYDLFLAYHFIGRLFLASSSCY